MKGGYLMKKRLKLSERRLPNYTKGEEIMNMVTHIVGGALGVAALTLCVIFAAIHRNVYGVVGSAIYGACMSALYSLSSVYHGLRPVTGKKVLTELVISPDACSADEVEMLQDMIVSAVNEALRQADEAMNKTMEGLNSLNLGAFGL